MPLRKQQKIWKLWEKFVSLHPVIQQMEVENTETMGMEEARELTHAAIGEEYAKVGLPIAEQA